MNTVPSRLTANELVVHAALGDEAVLLNIENGVYFGLDAVGTRIWELLAQGTTEEAIISQLLGEYDVEPVQLRADVQGFLQVLAAKGLMRVVDG